MRTATFHTSSSAARALNMPAATLVNLEKRGLVGPFIRDHANRRLLTENDIAAVRAYLKTRARVAE